MNPATRLLLVVSDIDAARNDLMRRGVEVSEMCVTDPRRSLEA
jgi:hypothetical protein